MKPSWYDSCYKESKIIWGIPAEAAYDRIDELRNYLENFPPGAFADSARHELNRLERMI